MSNDKSRLDPSTIARIIIKHNQSSFTAAELQSLYGWLRSRSYSLLASCQRQLGDNLNCRLRTQTLLQVAALFSKNADLTSKTADDVAWSSFTLNEFRAKQTNRRLDYYLFCFPHRLNDDLRGRLGKCARIIERSLGSYTSFLDSLPEMIRTTGGATSRKPRSQTSGVDKIRLRYDVTLGCVPLLTALGKTFGRNLRHRVVNFNRIAFVPKNYKTSRTVACEPEGLLPFQLACDSLLKLRLRRLGVDLSTQAWNQELCRKAAVEGNFATIDLEAASDSLAMSALEFLLPAPFFDLFCRLRSPYYKSSFGAGKYHKFASMGNGLTFPLETLIFTSVVIACGGKPSTDSAIYGDDIIVPSAISADVISTLKFLGFRINESKTFLDGPFKESCGVNFFNDVDITPFYWRRNPRNKAEDSLIINSLVERYADCDELLAYFGNHVRNNHIRLVPINSDPLSGVFVDIATAYKLKLLRVKQHGPDHVPIGHLVYKRYSSYVPPGLSIPGSDRSRGLYYWLMNRQFGTLDKQPVPPAPLGLQKLITFEVPRERVYSDNIRYRTTTAAWAYCPGSLGSNSHYLIPFL